MSGPGSREVGCVYPVKSSFLAFSVRQAWDPSGISGPSLREGRRLWSLAGDADQAAWLSGPNKKPEDESKPQLKLIYKRGKVSTTVELYGSYFKKEDMAPKLQKMRRVP